MYLDNCLTSLSPDMNTTSGTDVDIRRKIVSHLVYPLDRKTLRTA